MSANAEHVFVGLAPRGIRLFCDHCDAEEVLLLPAPADRVACLIGDFEVAHRECEAPDGTTGEASR